MTTEDTLVLPIGRTEFDEMSTKIIEMSGLPDNDSVRWTLAAAVLHFPQEKPELTYGYFARLLRRAASNQVASQIFQDLKLKQEAQQAAQKAAEEAAKQPTQPEQTAVTPTPEGVTSEQQKAN